MSGRAGNTRHTRPLVICVLSCPKRAMSESETWAAALPGPGIGGGERNTPLPRPAAGGSMAEPAAGGAVTGGGPRTPALGASERICGSYVDGKENCAAAVPGHPIAPNTRAASMPPAPQRHPIPLIACSFRPKSRQIQALRRYCSPRKEHFGPLCFRPCSVLASGAWSAFMPDPIDLLRRRRSVKPNELMPPAPRRPNSRRC